MKDDDIELDYDFMMEQALRYLVRDVLNIVADLGDAPGEHHFYIEFATRAPGVSIPDSLLAEYPERMTIVLQHQFDDLTVTDQGFGVTLWFKSQETRLEIPFDAVTSFADPSVQFGLRFEPANASEAKASDEDGSSNDPKAASGEAAPVAKIDPKPKPKSKLKSKVGDDAPDDGEKDGADVVSLDAFRKK